MIDTQRLLDRLDQMDATIKNIPGDPVLDLGSLAAIADIRQWAIELRDAPSLKDIEQGRAV